MKMASVVIPTKNRPEKLSRCLKAIAEQESLSIFEVLVCDSTQDEEIAQKVAEVCHAFPFVQLYRHDGKNVAAARNACVRAASTEILINVDDDLRINPGALKSLLTAYLSSSGYRVVAGSVKWSDWSRPIKMRLIGYGRPCAPHEKPDFLIGAFFIYPKILGALKPWNENIRTSDDRFMGALWRALGVNLEFCENAKAIHDHEVVKYGVSEQSSHIYANLFDALIANRNLVRIVSYEVLGFIWGLKATIKQRINPMYFLDRWIEGHRMFLKDYKTLVNLASVKLPNFPVTFGE